MQFRCERLYMSIRLVACYLNQKSQLSVLMTLMIHQLSYHEKGVIHVICKESVFPFETDYLIAARLMILITLFLSFLVDGKLLIVVIQQAISLEPNNKNSFSDRYNSGSVHSHCVNFPYLKIFWSIFSHIWPPLYLVESRGTLFWNRVSF